MSLASVQYSNLIGRLVQQVVNELRYGGERCASCDLAWSLGLISHAIHPECPSEPCWITKCVNITTTFLGIQKVIQHGMLCLYMFIQNGWLTQNVSSNYHEIPWISKIHGFPVAKYVATGRGLPTYRRPFIGETEPGTTKLTKARRKNRDEWHCLAKKHIESWI